MPGLPWSQWATLRCILTLVRSPVHCVNINLHILSVKENVKKRPFDAGQLGRQGAVRMRKEEVQEVNGHKFVLKQFYQVILCAFCSEFLLNAVGYQCEDCTYTCHKKCHEKVFTKCISSSTTGPVRLLKPTKLEHCVNHCHFTRMVMKRRLIIGFLIDLRQSPTSVLIGAATAGTCSHLAEKMLDDAQNARLLATHLVLILFQIYVGCRWRRPTSYSEIGKR